MTWIRLLASLSLIALPLLALGADEAALEDPLPIRRVLIPAARVATELERVAQGVLASMPRTRFETLVQEAARAGRGRQVQPRLIKASYKAVLEGNALDGSGGWTVLNPGDGPALLPIPDLNLALSKVKTEADYKDAVIGDLDGKNQALLIAKPGTQRINFDWSSRGVPGPIGLHFDLRLPACAAATLDLRLPPDQTVVVPAEGVMLSGPHDSESPRMRLWQLYFGGRGRVEFVVRRKSVSGVPPLLLTNLQTRQHLRPGRCQVAFDFFIDVLHSAVDELVFDCDPGLEPYDVEWSSGLKGWQVQDAPASKDKKATPSEKVLVVKLREPVQGTISGFKVRCLALPPLDGPWTSPVLRPRQAFGRGEILEINVHPDVRLEKWNAGRFRLMKTRSEADGSQTLSATAAGTAAGGRPHAVLKSAGVELTARQQTWWHVGAKEMTLATQAALAVNRGNLFQLALSLPAGKTWQIDEVTLNGKDLPGSWRRAGNTLFINLDRSLGAVGNQMATGALQVRLHSPLPPCPPGGALFLDFPDIAIIDPCTRTGTLAISAASIYQSAVTQSSLPATAPEGSGPWGKNLPAYFFPYRNHTVAGKLRLLPYPHRVNARCSTEVVLAPSSAAVQMRLELEPVLGNPDAVDLYLSAPPQTRWQWKADDNVIRGMERVPVLEAIPHFLRLGLLDPRAVLGLQPALPTGQRWRLYLGKPLERRLVLTLETLLESSKHGDRPWDVPLVSVLDAERMDGEVSVQLGGTELIQVTTSGLREAGLGEAASAQKDSGQQMVWRMFRYGTDGPLPRMSVAGRLASVNLAAREMCDRAELTTYVESAGRLLHHFRFRVWNWREQYLTLLLPPEAAQVLAAKADGRWIDMIPQEQTPRGVQIRLPVPAVDRLHRFEVIYASTAHHLSWPPWGELSAPAPQLPVAPTCFRRTWRLPPGLVPLHQAGFHCLTDFAGHQQSRPILDQLRSTWHAGDQLLNTVGIRLTRDSAAQQRQQVMLAEAAWRRKPSRDRLLGAALERLAFENLRDQTFLIDALALEAAGLRPSTKFMPPKKTAPGEQATPFWETAGLVYVPCPNGALFTTQREWDKWHLGQSGSFMDVFAEAVADAAAYGEDTSGRFRSVDVWLRSGDDAGPQSPFHGIAESFPGWTEWETLATAADPDRMTLVNGTVMALVGVGLALFLCLLAWRIGGHLSRRWSFRLLLAWLALGGLGLLWAPAGLRSAGGSVFVAAIFVFLFWYIRGVTRWNADRPNSKPSSAKVVQQSAALTVLLLLLPVSLAPPASSGGPEPATVYLLAGPAGAADRQTALVPPELLKRLDDLAGRGTSSLSGAVLVAARYKGNVNGTLADFKAVFDFYSFAEQAVLPVPLDGVDLKDDTFLDGKPVDPVAAPAPQAGYMIPVGGKEDKNGKGFHRLELGFVVRITPAVAEQSLRFLVPRLAQNQLELTLPPRFHGIQVRSGTGAERLTRMNKNAQVLAVDLGRENAVHVRWRQEPATTPAPQLRVRELYKWDLRPPAPALTARLQYSVVSREVSTLALALPEALEVRNVDIVGAGIDAAARLKSWQLRQSKGQRQLHIELLQPVVGDFQLELGLVPRLGLAPGDINLPLPLPLNVKAEGFGAGFLAYQLKGWEARESPQNLAVVVVTADLFTRAWRGVEPRSGDQPTRAFSFSRNAPNAALNLTLTAPVPRASQTIHWHVQPFHADLNATCELESSADDLMLVEWQVPPAVVLTGVSGRHVRNWSRQDALLQVWLTQPQKETSITLSGWMRNAQPMTGKGRFDLPQVHVLPAAAATVVQVRGAPGVGLEPERLQSLVRSPEREPDGVFAFASPQPHGLAYAGSFRLSHLRVKPQVAVLTTAKVQNNALAFTSFVDCQVPFGELRRVVVELQRWPGKDVKVSALGAMPQVKHEAIQNGQRWVVTLPPGVTRQFAFQLSGQMALPAGTGAAMPDVVVKDADRIQRWLAVTGQGLQVEAGRGVEAVKKVVADLARWPDEARRTARTGSAWQIIGADWQVKLLPGSLAGTPQIQVLLSEQEAVLGDRGRWVHQGHFLIFARRGADLRLTLPAGARFLAMALDNVPVALRMSADGSCWLPLAGPNSDHSAGQHSLRLRWDYDDNELLERPNLAAPAILGVNVLPLLGMIRVPAGYDADSLAAPVDLVFRRAEAQMQLSKLLGERVLAGALTSAGEIVPAQQRFYSYCRQAEYLAGKASSSLTPQPERWLKKLRGLRRQNSEHARQFGYEQTTKQAGDKTALPDAGDTPALFSLPGNGRPIYWRQDRPAPPVLVLSSRIAQGAENALFASEALLVILLAVGILSYFPALSGRLAAFWPEQLVLLAWLGWYFLGGSLVGLAMAVTGVSARLILLAAWVRRLLRRTLPPRRESSYLPGS